MPPHPPESPGRTSLSSWDGNTIMVSPPPSPPPPPPRRRAGFGQLGGFSSFGTSLTLSGRDLTREHGNDWNENDLAMGETWDMDSHDDLRAGVQDNLVRNHQHHQTTPQQRPNVIVTWGSIYDDSCDGISTNDEDMQHRLVDALTDAIDVTAKEAGHLLIHVLLQDVTEGRWVTALATLPSGAFVVVSTCQNVHVAMVQQGRIMDIRSHFEVDNFHVFVGRINFALDSCNLPDFVLVATPTTNTNTTDIKLAVQHVSKSLSRYLDCDLATEELCAGHGFHHALVSLVNVDAMSILPRIFCPRLHVMDFSNSLL